MSTSDVGTREFVVRDQALQLPRLLQLWKGVAGRLPSSVHVFASQGLDAAAQLITTLFVARLLGPELMGEYTFAFAVAGIAAVFLLFGTCDVAITLYVRGTFRPQAVLTASLVVQAAGAIVAAGVTAAAIAFADVPPSSREVVWLAYGVLLINGGAVALSHALVALGHGDLDLPGVVLARLALLAGAAWAASCGSLYGVVGATVAASLLLVAWRMYVIHVGVFRLRLEFEKEALVTLWRRGRRVGLASIFGIVSNRSDTVLLRALSGATETGLYGVCFRLVNGALTVAGAAGYALFPNVTRSLQMKSNSRSLRLFVALPVLLGALLVVGVGLLSHLPVWIFGDAYTLSRPIMTVLLVALSLQISSQYVAKGLIALGHERVLAPAQALAATTNVTLNLFLIPRYGAVGAAIATLAGDVVLLSGLASRRVVRTEMMNVWRLLSSALPPVPPPAPRDADDHSVALAQP